VLNLTDKLGRENFTPKDEQIMAILLEKAGAKLENQALYEGIYANLVDTLNTLVTTIEAKDPYTRDHSLRVTNYALGLAEMLGLDQQEREMIDFAGTLHDIGKIGVHDEILSKTGRLTKAEYEAIKEHPLIGERIVEPLGLSPLERAIVRNHHERFDGRGYPDRLGGEDIPLLARIVAVADAFDAMTTTRSYRQALSATVALEEVKRERGKQFDPVVAEALLEATASGRIVVTPPGMITPVRASV
jgi:putative nucleotidyltransferase with HDIG domain